MSDDGEVSEITNLRRRDEQKDLQTSEGVPPSDDAEDQEFGAEQDER